MANYHDISIAVAGVCQAGGLVQKFAHDGFADNAVLKQSLESLLVTQPENTLAVFDNDLANLKFGIETGLAQFGGRGGKLDTEIGRYWMSILMLSRKLNENGEAKAELAQRLQQIERQLSLYDDDIMNEQIIANLASIYSEVISPLGAKIQVTGSQQYLAQPNVQNRVRASLLAGVRAGILWQQVGGTRWQFLFSRKKILNQLQSFYQSL